MKFAKDRSDWTRAPPLLGVEEEQQPYGVTRRISSSHLSSVDRSYSRCMSRHHNCGNIPSFRTTIEGERSDILELPSASFLLGEDQQHQPRQLQEQLSSSRHHRILHSWRHQCWSSLVHLSVIFKIKFGCFYQVPSNLKLFNQHNPANQPITKQFTKLKLVKIKVLKIQRTEISQ